MDMVVIVAVLSGVGSLAIFWPLMAFFTNWQKDAPTATGLGNIYSEQYQDGIELNLRQQRALAAFFKRTLWPVLIACAVAMVVLIVLLSV
jgi:hypothetical protein